VRSKGFVTTVVFFFQAEDGIRDFHVTGVQTCALPISLRRMLVMETERVNLLGLDGAALSELVGQWGGKPFRARQLQRWIHQRGRSEERRVGKECGGGGEGS